MTLSLNTNRTSSVSDALILVTSRPEPPCGRRAPPQVYSVSNRCLCAAIHRVASVSRPAVVRTELHPAVAGAALVVRAAGLLSVEKTAVSVKAKTVCHFDLHQSTAPQEFLTIGWL